MIRRWSKKTKQLIAAVGVTIFICFLTSLIVWAAIQRQWTHERAQYERELEKLNTASAIEDIVPTTSQVWQFTRQIQAGEVITTKDIEMVRLDSSTIPEGRVKDKDNIIGQLVKIDVNPRMMVVSSLLAAPDTLDHDIRWIETAVIQLPLQLQKDDVLDIRIRFPNGLDYVLISHKKVLDLQKPTLWFHLSEQELLMLSSAYVDAFINGGQLYAVRYVDHMVQNKAIVNYPVRDDVLQLIKKDPNIVQKAQAALSDQSRKLLEQQLSAYKQNEVSDGASTSSSLYGSHATPSSGAVDPLHYSPFTGMAPESQSQSPFVGEATTQTGVSPTNTDQTQESQDTANINVNSSHNVESPQQQPQPFTDPDQTLNPSSPGIEMKTSQSQVSQSGQP